MFLLQTARYNAECGGIKWAEYTPEQRARRLLPQLPPGQHNKSWLSEPSPSLDSRDNNIPALVIEYLATGDEGGELAQGLLAGPADPQQQGVSPRELKDPADPRHVVHCLVEEDQVHESVRLVVLLGQELGLGLGTG